MSFSAFQSRRPGWLLPLVMLTSAQVGFAERSPEHNLVWALKALSEGKKEEVYPTLEKIVATTALPQEKFDAALVLALVPDGTKLSRRRSTYADAVLNDNLRSAQLAPATYYKVQRILADSLFDEKSFARSKEAFVKLAKSGDQSDQEYAIYKMGWLSLNEDKATEAFAIWIKFLEETQAKPGRLRTVMLRDLTRAWMEAKSESSDSAGRLYKIFQADPERYNEFDEGISRGLRFMKLKVKDLEAFRAREITSPLASRVVRVVAQTNLGGLEKGACNLFKWVPAQIDKSQIDEGPFYDKLLDCHKKTKSKDNMKRTLVVLKQLDPVGLRKLLVAEFEEKLGQGAEACKTLLNGYLQSKDDAFVEEAARLCPTVAAFQGGSPANTELLLKVISGGAPQPLSGPKLQTWLSLVDLSLDAYLKDAKIGEAKWLLETYMPFENSKLQNPADNERRNVLWSRWVKAVPENHAEASAAKAILVSLLNQNTKDTSAAYVKYALAMRNGMYVDLWRNQLAFEAFAAHGKDNQNLYVSFLNHGFYDAVAKTSAVEAAMQSNPTGKHLLKLAAHLQRSPIDYPALNKDLDGKAQPKFVKDSSGYKNLVLLSGFEKKASLILARKLELQSANFVNVLTGSIHDLERLLKNMAAQDWDEPFAREAGNLAQGSCETLIEKIRSLKYPKEWSAEQSKLWRDQLKSVLEKLEDWKRSLGAPRGKR